MTKTKVKDPSLFEPTDCIKAMMKAFKAGDNDETISLALRYREYSQKFGNVPMTYDERFIYNETIENAHKTSWPIKYYNLFAPLEV